MLMLSVFEDNEAVIQMIIKGRSPTMRHVSRTHRVDFDWLFDRINLDSRIQIRCIETKHQLADILTKGNVTCHEWNNLLHLFNSNHFSSTCCVKNSSLISCPNTMAKRMQEQKREEVWQKRNLQRWTCLLMFRQVLHPRKVRLRPKVSGYSQLRGILKARWEEIQNPTQRRVLKRATARCIPWRVDGHSHGETCRYKRRIKLMWIFPNLKLEWRKCGRGNGLLIKRLRRNYASSKSDCQGGPKAERIEWSHNLNVSPSTIHHTEAAFSIVREIYGRQHDDPMDDLYVNMANWGIFLNATRRAAVHLGQDYEANLRHVKNYLWYSTRQLFRETGKLIDDQKEITGVSTTGFKKATWMWTSLLCEKAHRITNAKTYVFSDSVLCVGKMGDDLVATQKSKIKWYSDNNSFSELNRIDGMPTEFGWKIFKRITTLGLLEKIPSVMTDLQCEPESQRKQRKIWIQFTDSCELCSPIPSRSLVFLGAWIRREVVRTRRIMESICREYDGKFLRILSSNISCLQCLWERRITKQRRGKEASCFSAQWFLWSSSVSTEQ